MGTSLFGKDASIHEVNKGELADTRLIPQPFEGTYRCSAGSVATRFAGLGLRNIVMLNLSIFCTLIRPMIMS